MRSLHISPFTLTLVFVGIAIVPATSQSIISCDPIQPKYTALSTYTDPSGNNCIGAGSSCTINSPVYVDVDKSFTRGGSPTSVGPLGSITIGQGGALAFRDASVRVEVASITVSGGTLQIGAATCPIGTANPANLVELDFYGTNPGTLTCANSGEQNPQRFNKGICFNSGTLSIMGAKGTTQPSSWTYLRCPAGPSSSYGSQTGVAAPVEALPAAAQAAAKP